jgi:hypothetical protein
MDMDDGPPRLFEAGFVSGNGFEVLGMNAYLGRLLTPATTFAAAPPRVGPRC